jgi:regulator of cell morphogenesis and NO signaling
MSPTTPFPFTIETKLGDIVAAQPGLARIFERLGLDYCCGGKQPLAQACARIGLDATSILATLAAAGDAAKNSPVVNPAELTLTQLADHIEHTHHVYVKTELPRLEEMAVRVATKHGWRDARLVEMGRVVTELTAEMTAHMEKEEKILFPFIRQIEAGAADHFHCGSIANPISQMEAEHEAAGAAVAHLRLLTNGFLPDAEACNTHRALLAGLAEFEVDLHQHVHKENNILFPRALDKVAQRAGA